MDPYTLRFDGLIGMGWIKRWFHKAVWRGGVIGLMRLIVYSFAVLFEYFDMCIYVYHEIYVLLIWSWFGIMFLHFVITGVTLCFRNSFNPIFVKVVFNCGFQIMDFYRPIRGGCGCEVSCGVHHRQRVKNTYGHGLLIFLLLASLWLSEIGEIYWCILTTLRTD